jgi:hypothetical protein
VRVEGVAEAGTVKVTLAFDDWKDGKVAPATFELPLAAKKDPGEK